MIWWLILDGVVCFVTGREYAIYRGRKIARKALAKNRAYTVADLLDKKEPANVTQSQVPAQRQGSANDGGSSTSGPVS